MVTIDGGLDRLIRILRGSPQRSLGTPRPESAMKELHASWKWSLAFQCVVNIGVRGSEAIRTRVVEAGMVPVAIKVLESYLRAADAMKEEEHARQSHSRRSLSTRAEPQEMRRSVFPAIAAQDADVSPANTAEAHGEFRELQRERSLGLPATMDSLAFGADPMFGAAPEHGRALQSAPPTNAPASPNGTEVSYGQSSREAQWHRQRRKCERKRERLRGRDRDGLRGQRVAHERGRPACPRHAADPIQGRARGQHAAPGVGRERERALDGCRRAGTRRCPHAARRGRTAEHGAR